MFDAVGIVFGDTQNTGHLLNRQFFEAMQLDEETVAGHQRLQSLMHPGHLLGTVQHVYGID